MLRVAKGFHGLHLYAHEFLIKHILRYAELQYHSKLNFSEALATQLERVLLFEKQELSAGFNAALRDHKPLPDIVQRLSKLNLPRKLQIFVQKMMVFQDLSAQDNQHREPQGETIKHNPRITSKRHRLITLQIYISSQSRMIPQSSAKYCINTTASQSFSLRRLKMPFQESK